MAYSNRRNYQQEAQSEYIEKVVSLNRVAKTVKGGRIFKFAALVVVGDGHGTVGFGLGKASEVSEAILKGIADAKKNMCKITLATGSMVGYAYAMEFFIAWYGANSFEAFAFINRAGGQYWWAYWIMITCNVITPQLFWFKAVRRNTALVWVMSIFVNVGMWFERFVITVTSLANDFLPSSWGYYSPTVVDIFTFAGTFGLFGFLFLLFLRFLPLIAVAEIKALACPQADPHNEDHPLNRKSNPTHRSE